MCVEHATKKRGNTTELKQRVRFSVSACRMLEKEKKNVCVHGFFIVFFLFLFFFFLSSLIVIYCCEQEHATILSRTGGA